MAHPFMFKGLECWASHGKNIEMKMKRLLCHCCDTAFAIRPISWAAQIPSHHLSTAQDSTPSVDASSSTCHQGYPWLRSGTQVQLPHHHSPVRSFISSLNMKTSPIQTRSMSITRLPRALFSYEVSGAQGLRGMASKTLTDYIKLEQPAEDRYATTPTNYLQLLEAINRANSLDRIEQLMTPELLQHYGAVHVSAALTRLPWLLRYRDKDMESTGFVAPSGGGDSILAERPRRGAIPRQQGREMAAALATRLCAMIPELSSNMFPRQTANCIWALSKLYSYKVPFINEVVQRRPKPLQPLPTQDGIAELQVIEQRMLNSGMASGFARAYASLIGVLGVECEQLHVHAQPMEVAQLLKGLALMPRGCQIFDVVNHLAMYIANRGAAGFKAHELCMASWGLASMPEARRNLEPGILNAALAAIVKQGLEETVLLKMTPANIASLMWSVAVCVPYGPEGRVIMSSESLKSFFATLSGGLQPQIVLMVPQDISMITFACARQRYQDPELMKLLGTKAESLLESFSPNELAQTLGSMQDLGLSHAPLLHATVRSGLAEPEISENLGLGVVASISHVFAFGGLQCLSGSSVENGAHHAQQMALQLLKKLRRPLTAGLQQRQLPCIPADVARMLRSLTKLNSYAAQLAASDLSQGTHNIVSTQGNSAVLDADDTALVSALIETAQNLVPSCSAGQLASLLRSVSGLQVDGLMLAAAAAAHMKQLIQQQQHDAGINTSTVKSIAAGYMSSNTSALAAARILRNSIDVLEACGALDLQDPELAKSIGSFLMQLQKKGSLALDGHHLTSLLASCHHMGAATPQLRAVVAEALLAVADDTPVGNLVDAFRIFAECSEASLKQSPSIGTAKSGKGQGSNKSEADSDISALETSSSFMDLETTARLAAKLEIEVENLHKEEQINLMTAVNKALRVADASPSSVGQANSMALRSLLKALS